MDTGGGAGAGSPSEQELRTRSLNCGFLGALPQWLGFGLLRWSHFRAQSLAARSRRTVMLSEVEIQRSLGFTAGRKSHSNG